MSKIQPRNELLIASQSTNTTSNAVSVDSASNLSFMFLSNTTSGSLTFTVEVSNDNDNNKYPGLTKTYVPYNRLNSNLAGADTRVSSLVMNATGSSMLFVPAGDTFNYVRVKMVVAGTATGTAIAYIN